MKQCSFSVSKACGYISNLDALVEGARTQMENWIAKLHKVIEIGIL